jgi:hypothetical protein
MILIKIAFVGVAIAVLLAVAKQERVFERVGVVGSCEAIASPDGNKTQWWECSQGVLTGFPTLPADACEYQSTVGKRERWSCSDPLTSIPGF